MKKLNTIKQKIIFYVMTVAAICAVLIAIVMAVGSVRSTNAVMLDNMQITARIASQSISANLHLLTERMYNLSKDEVLTDDAASETQKKACLTEIKKQIEFVWLAVYDTDGKLLYADGQAPESIRDTDYYTYMTHTGNVAIGDTCYDNELLQICVGAPLKNGDTVNAYVVGSYKYDILNDVLSLLILGDTGSASILNVDGYIVGDCDIQNIIDNNNIYEIYSSSANAKVFDKILAYQTGSGKVRLGFTNYYVGYAPIPGTNWALLVKAPTMEFMDSTLFAILFTVILTIILLVVAAMFIIPLAEKLSSSLVASTKRLQALAEGDLTTEVAVSDNNDETGTLSEALAKTISSLNGYIQSIQTSLGSLADGDYTIEVPDDFKGDFSSIRDSIVNITDSLNRTMRRMNQSSFEMNQNSGEVTEYAKKLESGSMEQVALLEKLKESMQAITDSIEKNKDNVIQIERCSQNAGEKTALGETYMKSMLETMKQVHTAVEEISSISQMIQDISDQTSLLALNASIEAARAGAFGKGFEVVATEIGHLSGQTIDALQQTEDIIRHSTEKIQASLETADQTAQAFQEIKEVTDQYFEISSKLSDTVDEQTTAVAYVNEQMLVLREIADDNRSLAEGTSQMASTSLEQSESLKDYASSVKIKPF